MLRWLANLLTSGSHKFSASQSRPASRPIRKRCRLELDALEDRCLLATGFTVQFGGLSFLPMNTEDVAALRILNPTSKYLARRSVAPVANNDQATATRNQSAVINVLANDTANGAIDTTTVNIVRNPTNGTTTVNSTTGAVTYTPTSGFIGQDSFTYTVKDNAGAVSNTATVSLTVVNVPPVANVDQANTNQNQATVINVLANDTDADGTLNVTTVAIVQNPTNGTASVNSTTGAVTYTPNTGFVGHDVFTYTVADNNGAVSNGAAVTINVNAPPVANNDQATVSRNQSSAINVVGNDTDADGTVNPTTVTIVQNPTNGTVSVNPTTGAVTYTPATGFVGQDSFTYTIKDNNGAVSNTASVSITVANVPPVANNDQAAANENQATVINVVANDTDADGTVDATTVTLVQNPAHGSATVDAISGAVNFTPTAGFAGNDTFTYTVRDNNGAISNVATVSIHVNAPPVANNDQATVNRNQSSVINVLANDTDADGTVNPTTVTIVQNPTNGTVSVNPTTGAVTYTPANGFAGQDSFTYTIKDNNGAVSNTAIVSITVVNAIPVANNDQATTNENQATIINVVANDTDADGNVDATTVTLVQNPGHGAATVDAISGAVTYTPTAGFAGNDSFTYTVRDNNGALSNVATVSVHVNAPPAANNDQATLNRNQSSVINVLANDTDADGTINATTVTIVQNPADGAVSVNPTTGAVTYTPTSGFIGQDSFNYTVKDNLGAVSNVATVSITVVNIAPVAINDQAATNPNQATIINVIANDTDADGTVNPATVTIAQNPTNGSVAVDTNTGAVTYTPNTGFTGQDNFTYTVKDNDGTVSNQATVSVRVAASPTIDNQAFNVIDESQNGTIVGTVVASEPNAGLHLTYAITQGNTGNTFQIDPATGQITVANNTQLTVGNSPFSLTVQVTDSGSPALSSSATMTINIVIGSLVSAALADDTGRSATDGITTDPTVTGTVSHADTVATFIAGLDDTNTANFVDVTNQLNNGAFTFDLGELTAINHGQTVADGAHTLRLQTTNQDGIVSPVFVLTFTLDRATPPFSMDLDPNFDTGTVGDQITSLNSVTLDGTTSPSFGVTLKDLQGTVLATTSADSTGHFTFTSVALVNGANQFQIQVESVSGLQVTFNRTFTRQDNAPTVLTPIANVSVPHNSASTTIDLAANFTDPDMTSSIVQFNTSAGPIDVQLFDTQTPQTVANFFDYLQSGAYNNTIFHRLIGGFVLQGGGYTFNAVNHTLDPIAALPAVPNEFGISNTVGTIAMAKLPNLPNSATDQFFFNLANNAANLDNQNGGFTVFGKILGANDQAMLNTLAGTPVANKGGDFSTIPLNNYTGTNFPTDATLGNFVSIQSFSIIKRTEWLTYSIVSNTNPGLVTASLNAGANQMLGLQYAQGQSGTATITIQATDRFGQSVNSSFQVTVTP